MGSRFKPYAGSRVGNWRGGLWFVCDTRSAHLGAIFPIRSDGSHHLNFTDRANAHRWCDRMNAREESQHDGA